MDAVEKRARELVEMAASAGHYGIDYHEERMIRESDVLAVIISALTPPDGYVLVPVERGAMYVCPTCHGVGSVTQQVHDQMIAARPEVP